MWLFFVQICLFVGNVHYDFYFSITSAVFLLGAFLVVWLCLHKCFDGCQSKISR